MAGPSSRQPVFIQMVRLEVEWGAGGEDSYHGMTSHRAQALLRGLNPALSFAVSRKSSQYSVVSGGTFLRILTGKDGTVSGFGRR